MASIKNLPTELLDNIFQYVEAPGFRSPGVWDTSELPSFPDHTLFPLNVATVCTLWQKILKSAPRYWQRIVIDVAADPAPFLDTLDLFEDKFGTPLDLIVFSSNPSIDKHLEYSRVHLVFDHLEPAIERYATITFQLVYESALPSPGMILCRQ